MCPGPLQNQGCGWRRETGLSPPVKYFTDRSKAVLLLWIFYVFVLSCVCYVFVRVCLYVLCGHLLGEGWPLGSRLWCLTVSLSLSHWYPWSGVELDCIDSWSLHLYLLLYPALQVGMRINIEHDNCTNTGKIPQQPATLFFSICYDLFWVYQCVGLR